MVSKGGGADRIRTGDKGFADLCLTTWPRRHEKKLVPRVRFELTRPEGHCPLKTACLPVPPPGPRASMVGSQRPTGKLEV